MAKTITRKEQLEMLLRAIDLPALVVEVTLDNIIYKPIAYTKLRNLILEELAVLEITVII